MPISCHRSPEQPPGPAAEHAPAAALGPADRTIRVLLAGQLDACRVVAHGPFNLRNPQTGELILDRARMHDLLVEFGDTTITLPQLARVFDQTTLEVAACEAGPVAVEFGQPEPASYRGALRLVCTPELGGAVVNIVDIEDYLVGVVAAELPTSFQAETFRAQAIAARTYAWYQKQTAGPQRCYDLTATESSQVYADLDRQQQVPQAEQAVRDTRGLVLTWPGPRGHRIFPAYYCSRCGGRTQSAAAVGHDPPIPPLAGDVPCDRCQRDPAKWGPVRLDKSFITQQLRSRYPAFESIGPITRADLLQTTAGGRPVRLALRDAQGRALQLEAENFRLAVDPTGRVIRSTLFTVQDHGPDLLLVDGRGFGHGIGLCQFGANDLARAGRPAAEILRHYYPGSRLDRAY